MLGVRFVSLPFVVLSCVFYTGLSAENDLSVLGEPTWTRLRPGWSLTVNDQCLYELIFQFEHDKTLPSGEPEFSGTCHFGDETGGELGMAPDGKLYLESRQMWERFPEYVWAATGFNHLSIDWHPCGQRPRGYAMPQYDFSFFRVTPEFRAHTMVCELLVDEQIIVPGEEICDLNQDDPKGMGFFIIPSALVDRNAVVNMPIEFDRPELGNGPIPHYGLRSWDQVNVPQFSADWNDLPIVMSTYSGDLVMWQVHVPHKMMTGEEDQFHSGAARYFETTVQTLPDTWAVDYDESEGLTRFIMVGKSGLCRGDFEAAQAAAGGAPIFPNYDDLFAQIGVDADGDGSSSGDDDDDDDSKSASGASLHPTLPRVQRMTLLVSSLMLIVYLF